MRNPNSPVGLATSCKFDGHESVVLFPAEVETSLQYLGRLWRPLYWILMGVMLPGYEAGNSPLSDTNLKSMPADNSNPNCIFIAW